MPQRCARLIEQERPHLVVPEIEAIATDALVALERDGIAQVIPTARAAQLTMNREGIRRLAAETLRPADLALPLRRQPGRAAGGDRRHDGAPAIGYPCVVKPVMSSSGKGQSVVRSKAEVAAAWQYAESAARVRGSRVIVEGFIDFDYEITLLTVRAGDAGRRGRTRTSASRSATCRSTATTSSRWQPQPMSRGRARAVARHRAPGSPPSSAAAASSASSSSCKGDEVWFSEVSPRPHDTGLVTMCTQAQSEFELHARAILGLPVDVTLRARARRP